MKFIDEAKTAWKFFSVWAMSAAIAIQGAYSALPESLRDELPPKLLPIITIVLLILGIIGRICHQEKPCEKDCDKNKELDNE